MIFRHLFDSVSSTYTYLLADRMGGRGIIDPVAERMDQYTKLIEEFDLKGVPLARKGRKQHLGNSRRASDAAHGHVQEVHQMPG